MQPLVIGRRLAALNSLPPHLRCVEGVNIVSLLQRESCAHAHQRGPSHTHRPPPGIFHLFLVQKL